MSQNSLYPSFLFHFTSKDNLYGILENTFKCSYAKEKVVGQTETRQLAVPMVSFSDLRLSEVKILTHGYETEPYGKFGIALSKDWANKNGLNPVLYLSENNFFTDNLIRAADHVTDTVMNSDDNIASLDINNIFRFTKSYSGKLERYRKTIDNYIFANEREWRFVPSMGLDIGNEAILAPSRIRTRSQKNEENKKLNENARLKFKATDIRYLVVEKESDILPLIHHFRRVKSRYSANILDVLVSKILTLDQIENDF